MKKIRLVVPALILLAWIAWIFSGRKYPALQPEGFLDHLEELPDDSPCARNIVAVQPYMLTTDYLSRESFYQKLNIYFEEAARQKYFHERTVVLLPEYLATWLVILNEKISVANAATVNEAMRIILLSNPVAFIRNYFKAQGEADRIAATIFRMKAEAVAEAYNSVFRQLAQTYQVTIVGGSVVLPNPAIQENSIVPDLSGPLYNTSFIFHPDGTIDTKIIRKVFPIQSELPFVKSCPIQQAIPAFDLPVGRTAVLICADSWYHQAYHQVDSLQAEIVLVNSYLAGNLRMSALWQGYNGAAVPDDVNRQDVGRLTEMEAWKKYSMPGRLAQSHARIGANVFLRGRLWDLGNDGTIFLMRNGILLPAGEARMAGIWNFCVD
jgi:predicted amidohydrolase